MLRFIEIMISTTKKRSALRKTKLKLHERYGIARFYTPEQVRTAAGLAGIDKRDLPFAYACFMSRDGFGALEWDNNQQLAYDEMRIGIEHIGDYPVSHSNKRASTRYSGSSGGGGFGDGGGGSNGGGGGGGGC